MKWRIHEAGPPEGPPALLLHGWLGSGQEWLPLLRGLLPHRRWLLPDLPGHGPAPEGIAESQSWTFESATEALVSQLLTHYQLTSWELLGYSMGGRFALSMATRYPTRIKRLLLESSQPGIPDAAARQQRAALDDQRATAIRSQGLESFVQRWYQAPLFASLQDRPALLKQLTHARLQHDPRGVAAALAQFSPGRQSALWEHLSTMPMPVALLAGDRDVKYTDLMREMARQIPGANLCIVPNTGHNVHAEAPQAWRRAVHRFLSAEGQAQIDGN